MTEPSNAREDPPGWKADWDTEPEPVARSEADGMMRWIVGGAIIAGSVVGLGGILGSNPGLGVLLALASIAVLAWRYRRRGRRWQRLDRDVLAADPPARRLKTETANRVVGWLAAVIVIPLVSLLLGAMIGFFSLLPVVLIGLPESAINHVGIVMFIGGTAGSIGLLFRHFLYRMYMDCLLWDDRLMVVIGRWSQTWRFDQITRLRFVDARHVSSRRYIQLTDDRGRMLELSMLSYFDELSGPLLRAAGPAIGRRLADEIRAGREVSLAESGDIQAANGCLVVLALLLALGRTFTFSDESGTYALVTAIALWGLVAYAVARLWRHRGGGLRLSADGARARRTMHDVEPWERITEPILDDDRYVLPSRVNLSLSRNSVNGRVLPYILAELDPVRYGGGVLAQIVIDEEAARRRAEP